MLELGQLLRISLLLLSRDRLVNRVCLLSIHYFTGLSIEFIFI